MARTGVSISGQREVSKNLDRALDNLLAAAAQGAYAEGVEIMIASKDLCPIDFVVLEPSGYCTVPVEGSPIIEVEMGYGGPAADYAVLQHENREFHHDEGKQAQYLRDPLDARSGSLTDNIADIVSLLMEQQTVSWPHKAPHMPADPWETAPYSLIGKAFAQIYRTQHAPQTTRARRTRIAARAANIRMETEKQIAAAGEKMRQAARGIFGIK